MQLLFKKEQVISKYLNYKKKFSISKKEDQKKREKGEQRTDVTNGKQMVDLNQNTSLGSVSSFSIVYILNSNIYLIPSVSFE